ncbi:MAG: 50S ribosomal protein L9 [Neomegalonema sp.]|nr:50S ribosomal protein L9 [Neomegalonema sp.]
MEVVLLQRVEKLGQMGDVVRVKDGYARNFLLPQGKALRATAANLKHFEAQRAQLEARNLELKKEADAVAEKLNDQSFVVIRSASEAGNLYGSVTVRDAAEAAEANGFNIDRRQFELAKPVKELGLHEVRVLLHPEVTALIKLNVARTEEEAEIQASGKSIAELRAEEEAAEDLDVAALFEDVGKFEDDEDDAEAADGEEAEASADSSEESDAEKRD